MAGQFVPNGTATIGGDDLIVSRNYQFGSGIDHATWGGAGVLTTPTDGSDPAYLFVSFPVAGAELKGNCGVLGLKPTASYDYRLDEVRVPRRRAFDVFAPTIHRGGQRYSLGVLPLTAAGHAVWALGVTRRALDELSAVATATRMGASSALRESERFRLEYGQLEGRYLAGKAWVRQVVGNAEAEAEATGSITPRTANLVREACRQVHQGGADIARQVYLLAGTRALRVGPLRRAFRDLHARSQYFFATPSAAIDLARALLVDA